MYVVGRRRGVRGLGDGDSIVDISATIDALSNTPAAPCMPDGAQGPLAPNQVWCSTGTGAPPLANAANAGAMPWGTLGLVLAGVVAFALLTGRRS